MGRVANRDAVCVGACVEVKQPLQRNAMSTKINTMKMGVVVDEKRGARSTLSWFHADSAFADVTRCFAAHASPTSPGIVPPPTAHKTSLKSFEKIKDKSQKRT